MTEHADLATPGAWPQTRSLLLLREVMDLGGTLRKEIADRVDLSETELRALEHIGRNDMGPAEIARALDVSTAASTGIVDRLEAKGHVERKPHADDRRRTQVVMTDHARGEVTGHMGSMFRALAVLDAGLTPQERAAVEAYLASAIDAVKSVMTADAPAASPPSPHESDGQFPA